MYSTADCLWQADFPKQKSEKRVTSLLIITLCINPDDRTKHLPHNIKSIIYNSTQKRTHLYNHLKSIPYSNINKLVINTKIKFGLCNIIFNTHLTCITPRTMAIFWHNTESRLSQSKCFHSSFMINWLKVNVHSHISTLSYIQEASFYC